MKPRIGFVGVGKMGSNIARHLYDLKYPISAINDTRMEVAYAVASELGTVPEPLLAEVTAKSDIIFTIVTDDNAMRFIFERPGDNLLKQAARKIFINCGTFSPNVHLRLAAEIRSAGAEVLEAPMASSITQARTGKLYLMCAGNQHIYDQLTPLLDDIAVAKKYIGPIGTALQIKALVNMVMNINTAALAEGLGLASALGLDLNVVKEVFGSTGADSRVLATDSDDMINRDHEAYFTAAHAAKDSGIALDIAREKHLHLPLAAATKQQYDNMCSLGLGHLDKSAISELTFLGRNGPAAPGPIKSTSSTSPLPPMRH